ncbi:hypothetical protein RB594_009411 [Gaeumannomyces avenae]
MYDDSWYSFVPDFKGKKSSGSQAHAHRRKESLLQQPNGGAQASDAIGQLDALAEDDEEDGPSDPSLSRRAKSYSDFYDIVREQLGKDTKKKRRKRRDRTWDALAVETAGLPRTARPNDDTPFFDVLQDELLEASQQEYITYRDKLALTERHLGTLIEDTDGALHILASLAESFRAVEEQTTSFQSQCDDLLTEQRRLEKLADDVRSDFYYYAYLEEVTRRLNAPGASRLADGAPFSEMLTNLESCIDFMAQHPAYRDAESYHARYQALLTKALHLLEVGFTALLDKVSGEISKQIAATQSESTRHALAYGRFEEMILDSYSLIPNIQKVVLQAYDRGGNHQSGSCVDMYTNTANNLLRTYLASRDRDLRPLSQADRDSFKEECKEASIETACRSFVKQCFERSHNEAMLFARVFGIDPHYNPDAESAFAIVKAHRSDTVSGVNVAPIATALQTALTPATPGDLQALSAVLGWLSAEYLADDSTDYYGDDDDGNRADETTPAAMHRREVAVRLLAEHLWPFVDGLFEAEIVRSITKAPIVPDALKIEPAASGDASSNAYPPVKQALDLLIMFDRCMPKERCQRSSPVVFKIVKESIQGLQRAEAKIKSSKNGTDPDLFMIKNLLILKNELLTLEIGDVRSQGEGMEHFGQIWDAISTAQGWVGYFSSFIPGASLFSRGSPAPGRTGTPATGRPGTPGMGAADNQDASEQLDELLRQSIVAFTRRWGTLVNDAQTRKLGGKNMAKLDRDLDELLQKVFGNQPEVVAKLKEAIQLNAQAQGDKNSKVSRV